MSTQVNDISFITAYNTKKDIGGEYNRLINKIHDEWIFIRDGDCMFLTSDYGSLVSRIIKDNGDKYDVIGVTANRLNKDTTDQVVNDYFNTDSITAHIEYAKKAEKKYGTTVIPTHKIVAGMCLLLKRSVWEEFPFKRNTPYFDKIFSEEASAKGVRFGIAKGLYVLHLYRWGQKNPEVKMRHLFNLKK